MVRAVPCDGAALRASRDATAARALAKVDTDACPQASVQHRIRSIPTLILFADGQEVARQSGALSSSDLVRWVRTQLGVTA
jgi:thioredoxin 2